MKCGISLAEMEQLQALARSITRGNTESDNLAAMGFAIVGESRYGTYARITERGREALAALGVIPPVVAPGPSEDGHLLRSAAPRKRHIAAPNARSSAAILPPAAAQDVGASSFIAPRTRRGT